jgi:hypothetical protein
MKELAQEALEQIKRKGYIAKYQADRRPVTTVSVCFDGVEWAACWVRPSTPPPSDSGLSSV